MTHANGRHMDHIEDSESRRDKMLEALLSPYICDTQTGHVGFGMHIRPSNATGPMAYWVERSIPEAYRTPLAVWRASARHYLRCYTPSGSPLWERIGRGLWKKYPDAEEFKVLDTDGNILRCVPLRSLAVLIARQLGLDQSDHVED